ncbi:MAG: hypothetical protein J6Y77_07595 [Paludibacteraceae bacterium]|nr:hypothetical protein [Paludibacteraceae bacterium]
MLSGLFSALLVLAMAACGRPSASFSARNANEPLAAGIALNKGYNIVFLETVCPARPVADSAVSDCGQLEVELTNNGRALMLRVLANMPRMAIVSYWADGERFDLPVHKNMEAEFSYTYPGAFQADGEPLRLISQAFDWQYYSLPELELNPDSLPEVRMMTRLGAFPFYLQQGANRLIDSTRGRYIDHRHDTLGILDVQPGVNFGAIIRSEKEKENNLYLQNITEPVQLYAFWGNRQLPDGRFVRLGESSTRISIPCEADSLALSWIRIIGANHSCCSNEILVPLNYGKVSHEVYPLPLVPIRNNQPDACLPAIGGNSFQLVHFLLNDALQRYGWHRLSVPDSAPKNATEALYYATCPTLTSGQGPATDEHLPQEWKEFFDHNAVLAYGDFFEWLTEPDLWVYERHYFGQSVVVVLNRRPTDSEVTIPKPRYLEGSTFLSLDDLPFEQEAHHFKLTLPAGQSRLLYSVSEEP